jgi:hypothetical protein
MISYIYRYRINIDDHTGRVTLTIVNCRPDDAGQYTCTAVNLMGQTDTTATLIPPEGMSIHIIKGIRKQV